ncbi:MAG: TonB-dependent receptor plug domain-containing protein [Bacteroidia bacterium]|nr:TonB-dependent receptor plug domain-containing protein [Bacteroidia bacterium]
MFPTFVSKYLFFILSFFVGNVLYAQSTATIYGKILGEDNDPVEDVSISILGGTQAPAYSNAKGEYSYKIPTDVELTIVFYSISHFQEQRVVKLAPNEELEINRILKFKNQITTVEVTDENRYQTTSRIDPINISHIPTASQDFNAILFTLPGVSNRNELSSAYSVRGGNFDENLVYVNGIEVYRPFLVRSGQQEGLSFINPDMVSSVLFSAGGFEAKYGDKMSSVLDVQYRRPRKFAGTFSGSLLGTNLHLEGMSKSNRFTWMVGARYKTNQYLLRSLDTKGAYKPMFIDGQAYFTFDVNTNWQLDLLGNYASNSYQIVPESRETDFGTLNQALRLKIYFDGQEIDKFQTMMGALSAIYRSDNEKTTLRFIGSVFNSQESEAFDIQGQYYIDELETDFGEENFGDAVANLGVGTFLQHARTNLTAYVYSLEHKGNYNIDRKKQVLWGIKYAHEDISDKLSEWKYVDSADFAVPTIVPYVPVDGFELQDVIKQKINITSDRVSGFLQGVYNKELKDTSNLSVTAGVRANYWSLNQQALFGPRATLGYKPNWKRDFLFKFSTGYYYQPPFYRELRDRNGIINYDLKAQTSIHFVLTSDYNFKAWRRPFKFVVEAYYKYLDNLIPYEIDNVRIRYSAKNNARGYATGIDLKVNGEFVKGVESWFSLSVMQTQEDVKDDFYFDYYNSDGELIKPGVTVNDVAVDSTKQFPGYIPRPTDQRVNFAIFFQDKMPGLPDLKMHLNLLFGAGVPFGPPGAERYKQTLRMPPYRRVDLGFSYQLLKEKRTRKEKGVGRYLNSVWLSLEVFNLLGTNNTVSYIWVEDVTNRQYAVPNYLTQRQLNLRMIVKF